MSVADLNNKNNYGEYNYITPAVTVTAPETVKATPTVTVVVIASNLIALQNFKSLWGTRCKWQ